MWDTKFYDSEKKWFAEPRRIYLTRKQIQDAFDFFKKQYKLKQWKLRIAKAKSTGVCFWEKKLIVSSRRLSDLLHELGHAITNTGHNNKHKKMMLKLYSEWIKGELYG